jgi:hypothetical protein
VPCFRQKKLMRLKQKGSSMLKKELNVIKIVKGLRDLKILAKHYLIDDKIQFNVNHNKRNVIKIDSSASDGSNFDLGIDP